MRNQFRNYNEAYAKSLNQQMLLNLARLENGHPAYYLAIGLIDAKYTYSSQTAAGATGSYSDARTATGNTPFVTGAPSSIASFPGQVLSSLLTAVFGLNLNETVTAISNPEFQFIPINNEVAAKQVLEPISTEVFLQLYQQGYPIDQLLRIMIERIETQRLENGERLVLVNSPTCGKPEYYERFLRACAILRTLQKHGYLSLEAQSALQLLGPVSFSSNQPARTEAPPGANGTGPGSMTREGGSGPSLKDFTDAEEKDLVLLTNNDNQWLVYRRRAVPQFFLKGAREAAGTNFGLLAGLVASGSASNFTSLPAERQEALADFLNIVNSTIEFLKNNTNYNKTNDYDAITNVVYALCFGIAIQTDVGNNDNAATRLVLRSFNRTMEAVAGEQAGFEALSKSDPEFAILVPDFERRPILQMIWRDKSVRLVPPLETIDYFDKKYQITDPVLEPLDPSVSWNRDVFRLMVDLSSQVTVDISKFQRQVLELEQ